MERHEIERLGRELLQGERGLEEFVALLARPATAPLPDTTLDLDRSRRCGFPEVVYGEGKTVESLDRIFLRLMQEGLPVLATRVSAEKATALQASFPQARYHPQGRTLRIDPENAETKRVGFVPVVTAGTSDLPVAEEARETLDWMGVQSHIIHDVGVAGPQRLLAHVPTLCEADAVLVVAGMEGALPSVVGGHVPCPVIGVPTSVGYGASLGGFAALLSMLNSCAANVTVVNIDAGFKAGYIAGLIARRRHA